MKAKRMWRRLVSIVLFAVISGGGIAAAAGMTGPESGFSDVPAGSSFQDPIARLSALGVINGSDGNFMPEKSVTREQFAKMMVVTANQAEKANSYGTRAGIFPDVSTKRWSNGAVQWMVKNQLMTGMSDRKFHPTSPVSYAQACTVMVRMLGYSDADVKGNWPDNYLAKAAELQLTAGVSFSKHAPLLRKDAALLIDRLLTTAVKSAATSAGSAGKTYAESVAWFQETVVLDQNNSAGLNEVKTTLGTFRNPLKLGIQNGDTIRLKSEAGSIVAVYPTRTQLDERLIQSVSWPVLTTKNNAGDVQTLTLNATATYYVNGTKMNYEQTKAVLKSEQSIIKGIPSGTSGNHYYVITDPKLENGSYAEMIILDDPDSALRLQNGQVLTDTGVFVTASGVGVLEKGGKYGVFVREDQLIAVQKRIASTQQTTIVKANGTQVTLRKNDGSIQNLTLPVKTIYYYNGTKLNYEQLKTMLKAGQTIDWSVHESYAGSDYAIIRDPFASGAGTYTEAIILANAKVNPTLLPDQLLTDQGLYMMEPGTTAPEIGSKLGLLTGSGQTSKVLMPLNTIVKGRVLRYLDTQLTWETAGVTGTVTLPSTVPYYYNGAKITYEQLKLRLAPNATLIFGYMPDQKNMEYAVILDPLYYRSEINMTDQLGGEVIGNIDMKGKTIIRDGKMATASDIRKYDLVYEMTDQDGKNAYILVMTTRQYGMFKAFSPNILSPSAIVIDQYNFTAKKFDSLTIDLGKEFNQSRLNDPLFVPGLYVNVIMGASGKAVDVIASY